MYSFGEYWFSKSPHSVIKSITLMATLRSSAIVRQFSRLVGDTFHLCFLADGFTATCTSCISTSQELLPVESDVGGQWTYDLQPPLEPGSDRRHGELLKSLP